MISNLYIDIDSTIWDIEAVVFDTLKRDFGIEVTHADITEWDTIPKLVNWCDDWFDKCFKDAFDPENICERELYPGVALGVAELFGMGFNIHFLSHNPKPSQIEFPIQMWLDNYINVPYALTIFGARNDKVKYMQNDPYAWGIIEDKPSTLVKAKKAGYNTIAKRHPYNLDVIADYDIISFDSWFVIADMLKELEAVCH